MLEFADDDNMRRRQPMSTSKILAQSCSTMHHHSVRAHTNPEAK
jgi:hypothetical protein